MQWKTPKTARDIAQAIQAELHGNPERLISSIASLEKAGPNALSFCTNKQYRKHLHDTNAGVVVLDADELPFCRQDALVMKNPRLGLLRIAEWLKSEQVITPGVHPTAVVSPTASISTTASVGAYCSIGDDAVLADGVVLQSHVVVGARCTVGEKTVLCSRVTLYEGVRIGSQGLIHSGAVIGSDGFGFAMDEQGEWAKMPHFGGVCVGDRVEIGANTTIDAGFLEPTFIGDGVIIDNLVQIGHNVSIGKRTAIAGCVGIAGSTKIGQSCLIGGGSSIAGHIELGDHVHITATSAVNRTLKKAGVYSSGFPARPNVQWRRNIARFQYLDEMAKRLRRLEKRVIEDPLQSKEESESSC